MTEHENYSDAAAKPEAISGHAATPAPLPFNTCICDPASVVSDGPNVACPQHGMPPGWYAYGDGTTRWWTGVSWVASSILQDNGPRPAASEPQPRMAFVVPPQRAPMNHTFHLIMSLITLGLWLPVWALIAVLRAVTK